MILTVDNITYVITFHGKGNAVEYCFITGIHDKTYEQLKEAKKLTEYLEDLPDDDSGFQTYGKAVLNPIDTPNHVIGRKHAFARAVKNLKNKAHRKALWDKYRQTCRMPERTS